MRSKLLALVRALDWRDLLAAVSLGMIGLGVGLVSVAAALIVVGGLLFWLAVWPLVRTPRGEG